MKKTKKVCDECGAHKVRYSVKEGGVIVRRLCRKCRARLKRG